MRVEVSPHAKDRYHQRARKLYPHPRVAYAYFKAAAYWAWVRGDLSPTLGNGITLPIKQDGNKLIILSVLRKDPGTSGLSKGQLKKLRDLKRQLEKYV